jgi:hypothetical protein
MARPHISPNSREILYVTDAATGNATYVTATNNKLDVNATASLAGSAIPIAGATTAVGVAVVDGSGNQITSFGGGTQYADGAVRGTATGTLLMLDDGTNIQSAAGTTAGILKVDLSATTANATAVKVDGSAVTQPTNIAQINAVTPLMGNGVTGTGSLRVTVASDTSAIATWGHGATGAAVPANAVMIGISDGTNLVAARQASNGLNATAGGLQAVSLAAQFDDVAPTSITENSFGNVRISANRNLYSTLRDAAGNERGVNVTAGNALQTDFTSVAGNAAAAGNGVSGTGVLRVSLASDSTGNIATIGTSVTPGTAAGNLGKAEDAVAGSGDTGVPAWGVRRDAPATNVNAAGDYAEIPVSGQGALWASLTPSTGGGWSVNSQTGLTNTKVAVKASAGIFGGYMVYNTNASAVYIQVFDVASASVTLGSTAPTYVIPLPASAAANIEFTNGITHATAITLAATTTATGSTAPGTALTGFFIYK